MNDIPQKILKKNLRQLDTLELYVLYSQVIKMRVDVLNLVQSYDFDANSLVSRTFEKAIESEYGRKILKTTRKDVQGIT